MESKVDNHNQGKPQGPDSVRSPLFTLLHRMPKSSYEQWTLYGTPIVLAMFRSAATYFSVVAFNGALEVVFSGTGNATDQWGEANITLSGREQELALDVAAFLALYRLFSLKDSHLQWMHLCLQPVIEKACLYYSHSLVSAFLVKTDEFQNNHDPQELAFLHYIAFERFGINAMLLLCSLIPSVAEFFFTSALLAAEGLYALAGIHVVSALMVSLFTYLYARFGMTPHFYRHLDGLNKAYPQLFQHAVRFPLIRNCGGVEREKELAAKWLGQLSNYQLANNRSQQFTLVIPEMLYTIFFALMLWFCAATMSADKLIVALLYLFTTYVPLRHVADSLNPILGNGPSFRQLLVYLYEESSFDPRYTDTSLIDDVPTCPVDTPLLRLQDVSYTHSGQEEAAIQDVGFALMAGQAAMVVGDSGQGKTTLVNVIHGCNYLQNSGVVEISGVSNRLISPVGLARHTYMVSQNTTIFAATIAENIRFVNPGITDQELLEVALKVGFDQRMLDRHAGFNGGSLSGGQKKWLALARALLVHARIIICDEITAGLDAGGQQEVMRVVDELRQGGVAIIFVTHRPAVANRYIQFEQALEVHNGEVKAISLDQFTEDPSHLSQVSMLKATDRSPDKMAEAEGQLLLDQKR